MKWGCSAGMCASQTYCESRPCYHVRKQTVFDTGVTGVGLDKGVCSLKTHQLVDACEAKSKNQVDVLKTQPGLCAQPCHSVKANVHTQSKPMC